jgi:hypothetical protein
MRKLKGENTHVCRESKATSPPVSIQRTCVQGETIPRFPRGGSHVQCYSFLTDLEEIATAGTIPVTGHLQCCLSHRRKYWEMNN